MTKIDAEREAAWLLKDKYQGVESPEYRADLVRLAAGEPLAYVIGWAPFNGTRIHLDTRPLIPRPETEYWVAIAIGEAPKEKAIRVLDLCAGSGCVGVSVLKALSAAAVDFAEIEKSHHATIEKNVRENGIDPSRARIFGGDLFENAGTGYDLILSNPPYIDLALSTRVDDSVTGHEPHRALWGGEGGMEVIERILRELPRRLAPGGRAYIEHEPEQAERILALCPGAQPFKDQFGLLRFTRIEVAGT